MKRIMLALSVLSASAVFSSSAFAADHIIQFGGGLGNVYKADETMTNTLTIPAGDTVTWNGSFMSHNLHELTGPVSGWIGADVVAGTTTTRTLNTPGTYTYECVQHSPGMNGTITVTAPPPPPPPPPTTTTTTTPPPTTTTTTTPPPADTTPPTTTLSAPAALKIAGLLGKGATVTVKANEDATVAATLSVGKKVVASGTATAMANADAKVALKVTKAGKALLKKKRTVSATLQVVTTDKAGNKKTDTKKIKLRK